MNCFAWSWHVEHGICAAGCSAAGGVAGIGAGAGVGAGGWGGVAGGCCAAANPGDKPRAIRRATPPRVNERFDIGILRCLPIKIREWRPSPWRFAPVPLPASGERVDEGRVRGAIGTGLPGVDLVNGPVLARAVAGCASLGRSAVAGEV